MLNQPHDVQVKTKYQSLVIMDDDRLFGERLAKAMASRGFNVSVAGNFDEGRQIINENSPTHAVIDIRLGNRNGLDLLPMLKKKRPDVRSIIVTGYGNLATAVSAIKMGAVDYLAKPANADEIYAALTAPEDEKPEPPKNPMSADRVRWEHIQRIYELCDRNVSETARRLDMHRRTLQRILAKRAPR